MSANHDVIKGLQQLLANSYLLMVKTHNYHWNVEGAQFVALHNLFEAQYQDLFAAVDEIAERIRALGAYAPGSLQEFAKLATIPDTPEGPLSAETMLQDLISSNDALAKAAQEAASTAGDANDGVSEGIILDRLQTHEKALWMLRSLVKEATYAGRKAA